jgi:hypothetical protein
MRNKKIYIEIEIEYGLGCTVRAVSEMPRPYVEDVKQA